MILLSVESFQDSSWAAAVGAPVLVLDRPFTVEERAAAASHLAERCRRRIARVSGAPQYCFIQHSGSRAHSANAASTGTTRRC
ncbi:hypothetical protein [Nonomuraea sp. NPDC049625]|uniref:hypothetical protein n=1 Tax=Nonomuraea sp. NPDC049625 TaxID=3155775 RepID=UPI0034390958